MEKTKCTCTKTKEQLLLDKETKNKILQITLNVKKITTNDVKDQTEALVFFRQLLAIDDDNLFPISRTLHYVGGVIPTIVSFLSKSKHKNQQYDAIWIITNICACDNEYVDAVIQANAVPLLVKLTSSNHYTKIQDQAVWALGNIMGSGPKYRDLVIRSKILPQLLNSLQITDMILEYKQRIIWVLSNVFRAKPAPKFDSVKDCFPVLIRLVEYEEDVNSIINAIWALFYITGWGKKGIDTIIYNKNVVRTLVKLVYHSCKDVQIPAIKTIGNIIAQGTDKNVDILIKMGVLEGFKSVINSNHMILNIEVVWILSNITAGTTQHIQAVFDAGIFQILIKIVKTDFGNDNDGVKFRNDALWTIANATSSATKEQISHIVNLGCVRPLCKLLGSIDTVMISVILDFVMRILKSQVSFNGIGDVKLTFIEIIKDDGNLIPTLKILKNHINAEVRFKVKLALSMMDPLVNVIILKSVSLITT